QPDGESTRGDVRAATGSTGGPGRAKGRGAADDRGGGRALDARAERRPEGADAVGPPPDGDRVPPQVPHLRPRYHRSCQDPKSRRPGARGATGGARSVSGEVRLPQGVRGSVR